MNCLSSGTRLLPVAIAVSCLLAGLGTVRAAPIFDGDNDGVSDERDRCLYSPIGVTVGPDGCSTPGDEDEDGIADERDDCPLSPVGALVDAAGCALDDDIDGIADGVDRCADTPLGTVVDDAGCARGQLALAAPARKPLRAVPPQSRPSPEVSKPIAPPVAIQTPEPPVLVPDPAPLPVAIQAPVPPVPVPAPPPVAIQPPPPPVPSSPRAALTPPPALPSPAPREAAVAVAQVPRSGTVAVVPVPEGLTAEGQRLLTLYFGAASTDPTAYSEELLARQPGLLKAELAARPQANVVVVGHGDTRSDGDRALSLAARRAETVRNRLVAMGLPAERLSVKAKGVSEPRYAGDELGRNRRVELHLYDAATRAPAAPVMAGSAVRAEFWEGDGSGYAGRASVRFGRYSSQLDDTALLALDAFALAARDPLRLNPASKVQIGGGADPVETAMPADSLARGRAAAVRAYLASRGLPSERLEVLPVAVRAQAEAALRIEPQPR